MFNQLSSKASETRGEGRSEEARGCVPSGSTLKPRIPHSVPSQSHQTPVPGIVWPGNTGTARASNNTSESANLFIKQISLIGSVELAAGGLYKAAGRAYGRRELESVRSLGRVLANRFPAPYRGAGFYFQALATKPGDDYDQATGLVEEALRYSALNLRPRILLTLAGISSLAGEYNRAERLLESLSKSGDLYTQLEAQRIRAVLLSATGGHDEALRQLHLFMPATRLFKGSRLWFEWSNSLAVEEMRAGSLEAAKGYSSIALSCPFAPAYPEWHDTACEIWAATREAEKPSVAIHRPADILPFIDKAKARQLERERRAHVTEINQILSGFNLTQTLEVKRSCRRIQMTLKARA